MKSSSTDGNKQEQLLICSMAYDKAPDMDLPCLKKKIRHKIQLVGTCMILLQ